MRAVGSGRRRRLLLISVLAGLFLTVPASAAHAHAVLIGASPTPNIGLGTPPRAVTLRFSEPVRLPPSSIRVRDERGRDLVRSLRLIPTDPQSMEAAIALLPRGIYRVEWKTVSTLDGHTIRGSYQFGVGRPPSGAPPESQSGPLAGAGIPGIVLRIMQDASLMLLAGLALSSLLAGRVAPAFASSAAGLAPWIALAAGAFTLATVWAEAVAAAGWSWSGLAAFLSAQVAGWGRTASVLLALAAAAALARGMATPALVGAASSLAAIGISGHAASSSRPLPAMAANAGHAVFAGLWLGTAAAVGLAWWRARPPREEVVAVIGRLSPFAVASALVVAGTGAVNALFQLTSVSDLWDTGYGLVVTGKIAAILLAGAFGAWHSFVLRPRLASASGNPAAPRMTRGVLRSLAAQRSVALAAVVLAAILVAFPDPPAQEARAERQATTLPALFAVGEGPVLTVAEDTGPLLISLTVSPPTPGEVKLAVQLVPSTELSTEGWRVSVTAAGPAGEPTSASLRPCGPGCFVGPARLDAKGTWTFAVDAEGRRVSFRVPIPTPEGGEVLRRLRQAWDGLRSVRIDEHFASGAGFALDTTYLYEVPDRSAVRTSTGREEISIGSRTFAREKPGARFEERNNPFPTRVPFPFLWQRASEEPRLLPDEVVGGREVHVLALFDPFGIWYRILVDKVTGRPLVDHMRAVGHFMDRTYSRFDESLGIRAPA